METLDVVAVLKAMQEIERNVSVALMYSGLRIPQFRLLDTLDALGPSTVTDLSHALHITRASTSVLVNEMLREEVLVAVDNPSDRRSFHVRLSELGTNKLKVARSDLAVMQKEWTRHLPAPTIAALNEFAARTLSRRD